MAVLKLTEKRIRDLEYGSGIWRDEAVKGLMVICHKTTKSYAVQGDVRKNGRHFRTVRVTIDRVDRIGLAEARRRAKALMSTIQSGVDPTAKTPETGITLKGALEAHLAERDLRPTTVESYRDHLDRYLKRFRGRAVADISRADVRELLDDLMKRHGRNAASGALRTLRAVINTARRIDESLGANPVDAVRVPTPRRRQIEELEVAAFWTNTETLTPIMRDLQRTFLLTGARRRTLAQVKREDVDLERRILRFTHMKTGGGLLFPMGRWLTEMLAARMEEDAPYRSKWLWPSPTSRPGHVVEPKRYGFPGPHALRHSARTLLIAAGVPYAESALLLGHRLPGATGGYVHPEHLVEALRPHAQALEDLVLTRVKTPRGAK